MTKLSVNINKIATLRNSRGGDYPNVCDFAKDIQAFGAAGITVHPRPDERHIKYSDVYDLKDVIYTEFNIEGNPIDKFIKLVTDIKPTQVTLVPDEIDAITSNAGWDTNNNKEMLDKMVHIKDDVLVMKQEVEDIKNDVTTTSQKIKKVIKKANLN